LRKNIIEWRTRTDFSNNDSIFSHSAAKTKQIYISSKNKKQNKS